jgi:hypothetical protein
MASGNKNLVMNALERALSTDINRLQNFESASVSEMLRALIDTGCGTDDLDAGSLYVPNTVQGNPLAGEIFSGLLFAPTGGGTSALISPGVVAIFDPDTTPSADDSQYKLIQDPGTVTASLNLTSNASGSLRIDVIECSRVQPDNILETDSRDVYVPSAGTFTAITVNKVAQAQLQYRIRLGTVNAGFPGTAQGWLPIAVASVPTGTTTWDTVTVWDVRPLLEDRVYAMTAAGQDMPRVTRCMAIIDATSVAVTSTLRGTIEAQMNGRRLGGVMRASCNAVTLDTDVVNLDATANIAAGVSIAATGLNYIYLATPFGLPRWAKYTAGPSGRVPRSPRGILFNTNVAPDYLYGTPHASLVLPPCLQDGSNAQVATRTQAVCILARVGTSAGGVLGSLQATGGIHLPTGQLATVNATASAGAVNFVLTPGTHFPANARAIHVFLQGSFTIAGTVTSYGVFAGSIQITRADAINGVLDTAFPQGNLAFGPPLSASNYSAGTGVVTTQQTVRIPIPNAASQTLGNSITVSLVWTPGVTATGGGSVALSTSASVQAVTVVGWELSDAAG